MIPLVSLRHLGWLQPSCIPKYSKGFLGSLRTRETQASQQLRVQPKLLLEMLLGAGAGGGGGVGCPQGLTVGS